MNFILRAYLLAVLEEAEQNPLLKDVCDVTVEGEILTLKGKSNPTVEKYVSLEKL